MYLDYSSLTDSFLKKGAEVKKCDVFQMFSDRFFHRKQTIQRLISSGLCFQ